MNFKKALLLTMAAWSLALPAFADEDTARRLKQIEDKQDQILAKLDALAQELQIVKVRATK